MVLGNDFSIQATLAVIAALWAAVIGAVLVTKYRQSRLGLLWALVPLSGWADRSQFRVAVVAYSAIFSLTVLPRGLGLPPGTVLQIYLGSIAAFVASMAIILAIAWRTKVFRLR